MIPEQPVDPLDSRAVDAREFLDDADVALKSYGKNCCAQNTSSLSSPTV
jgi:hypothetical protein